MATNHANRYQSPFFSVFNQHYTVTVTVDTGAEGNFIRQSMARTLNANIRKSSQSAHQADGASPLYVVGETTLTSTRDRHDFLFEGLVVEDLDVDILAGIPFMEVNDISIRPAKHQVILNSDNTTYLYGSLTTSNEHHTVRRTHVSRAPSRTATVWSSKIIEVDLPQDIPSSDSAYASEPCYNIHVSKTPLKAWSSPTIEESIAARIRVPNLADKPLTLRQTITPQHELHTADRGVSF